MSTLTQVSPPTAFILSEANGQRSRENFLVSMGRVLKAGEVVHAEDAVDLTTTASTHSNKTLDTLAATTGLVSGDIYAVTGTGIPAGTTFTYGGASAGTLSANATATGSGVSMHFTRPAGVGSWLDSSDTAVGISLYPVDATAEALMASFLNRDAEVNLKLLVFPTNDDADVVAGLAALGVICRD